MDPFSYLSFLTSIVLGLGITHLLTGLGRVLQGRHGVRLYWVHLVWTLNVFLYQVLLWWILFRWNGPREWSFFLFLFLLLSPTITFLLSVLLFPDQVEIGTDFRQHFFTNHRAFFALAAPLPLLDAADTLLKGWEHFQAQGMIYPVTILLLFGLNVLASRTRSERFHAGYAVFFMLYLLFFITINLRVLS